MGIGLEECGKIRSALAELPDCVQTDEGTRFTTQCLYPSFESVDVFVVRYGDGYRVHDGGGAVRSAWDHGRDLSAIRHALSQQASSFHVELSEDALVATVEREDWLLSAVLSVANASALAAREVAAASPRAAENDLKDQILSTLYRVVQPRYIAREYEVRGRSGKKHKFDFGVQSALDGIILLNAVSPHHVSISSKYVVFADTSGEYANIRARFAVHDRPLEPEDVSLLQQVADIVPLSSLERGVRRQLAP